MRLAEFDATARGTILELIRFLKKKADSKHIEPEYSTKAFLHMLSNVGVKLDKEGFEKMTTRVTFLRFFTS